MLSGRGGTSGRDEPVDPSTMWFADEGEGDPLLVLHPGGTDARALNLLLGELGAGYRVLTPEQRGHGRTPDIDDHWHFAAMAADTAALLDDLAVSDSRVVGWSDGAIVGLHLALLRPDLVASLVFGGAPFDVNGWCEGVLVGEPPAFMAEAYAELSPDGGGHWPVVVAKADRMHKHEPAITEAELRTLAMPVLIVLGDDDQVRIEHAVRMYQALPDGELAIVPRATHGLIVEKPGLLARLILDFHAADKSDGIAPIRRAR